MGSEMCIRDSYNPPEVDGKDDVSGEDLIQRDDDQEDTIRNRLEVYREQTQPLVAFYSDMSNAGGGRPAYCAVDGVGDTDAIKVQVETALKEINA